MHAHQGNNQSDTAQGNRLIQPEELFSVLQQNEVNFFCGVPDSLLKSFCAYVTDEARHHVIAANEGNAIGLAIGYHLATGQVPLVYMQNSGLGNSINPLLSLADKEVYGIPMLLLIGWRGEPGVKDEPQHVKQGRVMLPMLDAMEIPYAVLPDGVDAARDVVGKACETALRDKTPYAIVVTKDAFAPYVLKSKAENSYELSRRQVIEMIAAAIDERDVVVSTTGFASRELFEYRKEAEQGHRKDFLTVGGMGHTSQIALGMALGQSDRNVYCIDGDGSALMHLGGLAVNGFSELKHFKHIVINNGAHHSVGGQETAGFKVSFAEIAKACGYQNIYTAYTQEELVRTIAELKNSDGPSFLEVRVNLDVRKDLGRPTTTPAENKEDLMEFLQK